MSEAIDFPTIIARFDTLLSRGLCSGVGTPDGQMCIEAAICAAMDLPFGDDPPCVARSVRSFKIRLNDARWSSPEARAKGLRDLGIAQIGSRDVVDDRVFTKRMAELTIRELIPALFRLPRFQQNARMQETANRCEQEGTRKAALNTWSAADAAEAAYAAAAADAAYAAAAADAAYAAAAADAAYAAADAAAYADAYAAADAADAADAGDRFLLLSASLALRVLRELNSPGVAWL